MLSGLQTPRFFLLYSFSPLQASGGEVGVSHAHKRAEDHLRELFDESTIAVGMVLDAKAGTVTLQGLHKFIHTLDRPHTPVTEDSVKKAVGALEVLQKVGKKEDLVIVLAPEGGKSVVLMGAEMSYVDDHTR